VSIPTQRRKGGAYSGTGEILPPDFDDDDDLGIDEDALDEFMEEHGDEIEEMLADLDEEFPLPPPRNFHN
jgi:hypothetical protein